MRPFERLMAWPASHELYLQVYRATSSWPATARYGLTAQIRRAALSVGCNLAEGVVRRTPNEFARFIEIALGSLSEVSYQLIAARDIGLLGREEHQALQERWDDASKLTWRLYREVRRRVPSGPTNRLTD